MGSRHFGHPAISSLIRVKVYDFALYMDRKQVGDLQTQLTALSTSSALPSTSLSHGRSSSRQQLS